jgi:tRNA 2-selenouridine synthase
MLHFLKHYSKAFLVEIIPFEIVKIEDCYGKYTFVDVRSPKEFEEDCIPGAINIPLFSNEERAIVGTLYKQVGKDVAIDKGLEIVSKKLPLMINEYKKLQGKVIIYCWRGGMRSGSITGLLKSMKFDVEQLEKGYKDYRRFVREELEKIKLPETYVVYGLTGSGKTELLQEFENSLDLEGLAQHRGSVFGDIGLEIRSQKKFESLLLKRLIELKKEKWILVEGESRKIGKNQIPLNVWEQLQCAKKIKLSCSMKDRIERLHKEYCKNIDKELIINKLKMIEKYLGKKNVEELIKLIEANEIKKFIEKILVEYYDKLYKHTVDSKEYEFEITNSTALRSRLS